MNLTFLRILWSRKNIKIFIVVTAIGGILQIAAKQYLKDHPEFLEENNGNLEEEENNENLKEVEPSIKNENRKLRFRRFFSRGGALPAPLIQITGVNINLLTKIVVKFIAKKGLLAGVVAGSGAVLTNIPKDAISTYLRDSFPQNLPELERKKFILIKGEKIYLNTCDQNLTYLFTILKNPTIPFKEKQAFAYSTLTKYLNLKTADGRLNFVLCLFTILHIFSEVGDMSNYFIILKNLIKAIKEGRISKLVGRAIIRKLKSKGLPVDPELLEIVN